MDQLAHTNRTGVKNISLLLIAGPPGPEIITIGGSQPFGRTGKSLDNTMIKPPVIHSNQTTTTDARKGHDDRNVSLGSLEICPEIQRGGIERRGNDGIKMNPPGTIGGKWPYGTGPGGFNIFDYVKGMYDFTNRSASWHDSEISENPGRDRLSKNDGHAICFEVEKDGQKNSKILLQSNHYNSNHTKSIYSDLISAESITDDSKKIGPKNKHDSANSSSLHKMMS